MRLLLLAPVVLAAGLAAKPPAVRIMVPARGAVVTGSSLTVHLAASGVRIVPATGLKVEGEAHHHVFLDADLTPADSAIPKTAQIFHLGNGADSLKLDGLAPGTHRLIAVLAWGNHVPVSGARTDTVTFTVKP